MRDTFVVRRIRPEEWETLRDLRMEALHSEPTAFGSTLERERAFPPELWQERAGHGAEGPGEAIFFTEIEAGRIAGMAGVFASEETLHIVGMWVSPGHRRRGMGEALLRAVTNHCAQADPSCSVVLEVNPGQTAAVALYERLGFRATGEERPLGHHAPAIVRVMAWSGKLPTADVPSRSTAAPAAGAGRSPRTEASGTGQI